MCGFNIDGNFWQSLHFGPKCTYMSHRDKNISKMYTHQILSNPKQTNLWRLCPNLRINPQISNFVFRLRGCEYILLSIAITQSLTSWKCSCSNKTLICHVISYLFPRQAVTNCWLFSHNL